MIFVLNCGRKRFPFTPFSLHDSFHNTETGKYNENEDLAADGIITDLVYCSERYDIRLNVSEI